MARRFFSGNPLTRAISERTIAVVSTAGFSLRRRLGRCDGRQSPCPYAASTAACSRNSAMRLSIVESFVESVAVIAVRGRALSALPDPEPVCGAERVAAEPMCHPGFVGVEQVPVRIQAVAIERGDGSGQIRRDDSVQAARLGAIA